MAGGSEKKVTAGTIAENSANGKFFEAAFHDRALINGLRVDKMPLSCRHTWGGRVQIIKSELDYRLTNPAGRIGYFDCKSFKDDGFPYSDLNEDQVNRAVEHNRWNVPAGFVVFLRATNKIVFFSGNTIAAKGSGFSFKGCDGFTLGTLNTFSLKPLLA